MPDNELVNVPGRPLDPWAPNQPLDHHRLNRMQSAPVTDVQVRGKGVRSARSGGTVTILLPDVSVPFVRIPVLHITGPATGGGQYVAREVAWPDTWDSTADLDTGSFGADGDEDVLFVNLQEIAGGTHWLTHADNADQLYFIPDVRLPILDDEGRTIYMSNSVWVAPCTTPTPTPTPTPSPSPPP